MDDGWWMEWKEMDRKGGNGRSTLLSMADLICRGGGRRRNGAYRLDR